ncbi:MAG: hypothetical protein QM528_03335 [Phycisphaerales bacterium]|nr:hypothetical protein [Phycisphaerales bacterium]
MKKIGTAFILSLFLLVSCWKKKSASDSRYPPIVTALYNDIRTHPDSFPLRLQLVSVLDSLHLDNLAIPQLDTLLKKDSINSELWFKLAVLYQNVHDTTRSIHSFAQSLKIYPTNKTALLYLATLYAEKGNPRSLGLTNEVNDLDGDYITAANCDYIRAIFFERTHRTKQAIYLLDKAIGQNFKMIPAYIEKGIILENEGQFVKALMIFQSAQKIDSKNPDIYYYLGTCLEKMDNLVAATTQYQNALTMDSGMQMAKDALARIKKNTQK